MSRGAVRSGRLWHILILVAFLAPAFAGCIAMQDDTPSGDGNEDTSTEDEPEQEPEVDPYLDAYQDAEHRYTDRVAGAHQQSYTFNVAPLSGDLRVAIRYDVAGAANFVLRNPLGIPMATIDHAGAASTDNDEWYSDEFPMPGPWSVSISLSGAGQYAVGVYN